jgi:hypothetical protein
MMQAFRQALPAPLDGRERAWYEALFSKQDHIGGLPLVLLRHRFDVIEGTLDDLVARPGDPAAAGVLLRLLQYYGEMASARRAVDRARKRRPPYPGRRGPGREPTLDLEAADQRTGPSGGPFRRIVARLLEVRGLGCSCPDRDAWSAWLREGDECAEDHRIGVECERCGYDDELRVGRGEFERVGRGLLPGVPPGPAGDHPERTGE